MITKKQLAILLSKLATFEAPKAELEQYPLDGETASAILWDAFQKGDIQNRTIADFGCGTGILGLGALLLGAKKVYFIDKSEGAIRRAKQNLTFLEREMNKHFYGKAVWLIGDISLFRHKVYTVLENPPFGTKQKHIDRVFLEHAMEIGKIVYSIHKTSTIDFIKNFVKRKRKKITSELKLKIPLKKTMPWHKHEIHRIDVTYIRVE
ncbi:MAG: METTL5 family protein [Candidatus Pacearchaeota archaeon]